MKQFHFKYFLLFIWLISTTLLAQKDISSSLNDKNPFNHYAIEVFTTDDGLPQNSVNQIVQTNDGYLWIATYDGLLKYDGSTFEILTTTNTPEMVSNRIIYLHYDSQERLWIMFENEGVIIYENGEFKDFYKEQGLENISLNVVVELANGHFWLAGPRNFFTYNGIEIQEVDIPFTREDDHAINFSLLNDNKAVVFGYYDVYFFSEGKFSVLQEKSRDQYIKAYNEGEDKIIFLTDRGLRIADKKDPANPKEIVKSPKKIFENYLRDSESKIWLTSVANGIYIFKDGEYFRPDSELLRSIRVKVAKEDHEGNIWLGTNVNGLIKLKKQTFTHIQGKVLSDVAKSVSPVLQTSDGDIWVGFNCNGVHRISGNYSYHYGHSQGILNQCVWSLYESKDKILWMGTYGSGIYKYSDGMFINKNTDFDLKTEMVFAIYEDTRGDFWVAAFQDLIRKTEDKIIKYNLQNGLRNNYVRNIFEDSKGRIWIATASGASYFEDEKFFHVFPEDSGKSVAVRAFYEDKFGRIYFGTYGSGLVIWDEGVTKALTEKHGLHDNVVSAIQPDNNRRLWLTSNNGISVVKLSELNEFFIGNQNYISSKLYGKSDGLINTEFNGGFSPASEMLTDGRLAFPTINGIAIVDPDKAPDSDEKPNLIISKVVVDTTVYVDLENIVVEPGFERIEIYFTSIGFNSQENIRFRYKLEGLNENWSSITQERSVYYNYLPSGKFIFKLYGTNSNGMWSDSPVTFELTVNEHFYETWQFYVISLASLLIIITLIYVYRIYLYRNRQRELEHLVDIRTKQLQIDKAKIEKYFEQQKTAKGKIEQQNEELEKLNSSKDKFFSIISHDLKNPFTTIIGYSDLLLAEFDNYSREEIKQFVSEIKSNSANTYKLLEDLLSWANSQQGNIILNKQMTDLSDLARRTVLLYMGNARKKEITIEESFTNNLFVYIDVETVSTILRNLLSNAVKFSYRGGTIKVSVRTVKDEIVCEVRDSGCGMAPNQIANMFNLVSNSTPGTEREKGTGLGMIISKEFAIKNGGDLQVKSKLHKGSSFFLIFPIAPSS